MKLLRSYPQHSVIVEKNLIKVNSAFFRNGGSSKYSEKHIVVDTTQIFLEILS